MFDSTSVSTEKKVDISLFVQKPNLRKIYIESNIAKDIDSINQSKFKNSSIPLDVIDAVSNLMLTITLTDPV